MTVFWFKIFMFQWWSDCPFILCNTIIEKQRTGYYANKLPANSTSFEVDAINNLYYRSAS
jgi:hypothetical protein